MSNDFKLPEKDEIDKAIKKAMEAVEEYKPELKGVLPQDEYFRLTRTDKTIPEQLLKNFSNIPEDASGDMFGQIYEYFLGKFTMAEGQGGGEFFTPRSVVRLMVEIIEPHRGTVFDPACGSGGMFVQSAHFIERHREELKNGNGDLFVYGQEKHLETVKLAKMNLAVNGLRGDIRQGITYYEDHFKSFGNFDYVMANPPFNVDDVSLKRVEGDKRFNTYGIPHKKTKVKKNEFIRLVDRYFAQGMEKLTENKARAEKVSEQLLEVLNADDGKQTAADLIKQWSGLKALQNRYDQHLQKNSSQTSIEKRNKAQQNLRMEFDPFFKSLHHTLKQLDKTVRRHEKEQAEKTAPKGRRNSIDKQIRDLKAALETLHTEVKNAESFYKHIQWLQERFRMPNMRMWQASANLPHSRRSGNRTIPLTPAGMWGWSSKKTARRKKSFLKNCFP